MVKLANRISGIVLVQCYLAAGAQGTNLETIARSYIDQMTDAYQNYFEARQTIDNFNQGMALARMGDCPAALIFLGSFLDQIKVLQPRLFVAAHRESSNCYQKLGNPEKSIKHWQNSVRIQSQFSSFNSSFIRDSIASMLPTLIKAPAKKRHEVALFLREILALDWPTDAESEIAYTVGLLHYQNGDRKALEQLKPILRLLKEAPEKDRRIALQRAILTYVVGDPPSDNTDILKTATGSPTEEQGQFLLVQARLQAFKNRPIDALELFGKVPKDSESFPHALVESSQILLMIGRPAQAKRQIETFLDTYSEHELRSDAQKLLLLCHLNIGDSSPTRNLLTNTNQRLQKFLSHLSDLTTNRAPPRQLVAETQKVQDLIKGHPALNRYLQLEEQKIYLIKSLERLKDRRSKYLSDLQDSRFVPNIEKQTFLFNNLYRMSKLAIATSNDRLSTLQSILETLSTSKPYVPVLQTLRERRHQLEEKMTSDPFQLKSLAKFEMAQRTLSALSRRLAAVDIRVANIKYANRRRGERLSIVLADLQTRVTEISEKIEVGAIKTAKKSESIFGAQADILQDHWQATSKSLEVVAQLPLSDHDLIQVHQLTSEKTWNPIKASFDYLISEFRRHNLSQTKQLQKMTQEAEAVKLAIERLATKVSSIEQGLSRHFIVKQKDISMYYQREAKKILAQNNKSLVDLDWIDIESEDSRRQRLIRALKIKKLVQLAKQSDIHKLKISL